MCTCIWNLKTMPVNNEDAHLYTQNLREKLAIFEALFKSLSCFQCSWNLQGIFLDDWSRDYRIYKKIYRAVFGKMRNFQAWTKLRSKTVSKAAECKLIKFFLLAIAQSNSPLFLYAVFNGIKPLWDEAAFSKLIIFLKYQRIVWLVCYFTVFMIPKSAFQNISKTLS